MKPGLSKREKILLFSAGLVLILYLSIQFAIVPLSNAYRTSIEERDHLRSEKATHELAATTLPNLRVRSVEAHERFYELTSGYPELVPNELIDQLLTTLCGDNNMSIISLRFAPRPAPLPPAPYPPENDEAEDVYQTGVYPVFTDVTAFMNVTGSYGSLLNLIDEVKATEFMRLTNVSFTRNMADAGTASTISLTFEVTYLTQN